MNIRHVGVLSQCHKIIPNQRGINGEDLAAVADQLAPDKVHRLDAVRTFINHGDSGIADELFHAVIGDIAMTAEHLLRVDRALEADVGQIAFDDRGQPCNQRGSFRTLLG